MLSLLPPPRAVALTEGPVTIDLDTTDVEVYGRSKRGVADNWLRWGKDVLLERLATAADAYSTQADGRWIGMLRAQADGRAWIEQALDALGRRGDFDRLTLGDLLNQIVGCDHPVRVIYIHGHWLDVNSLADLEQAGEFTAGQH
jgi:hypothetical protein